MPLQKHLWRFAQQVQQWFNPTDQSGSSQRLDSLSLATLEQLGRQLSAAKRRGFTRAARKLNQLIATEVLNLREELDALAAFWRERLLVPQLPRVRDLYEDLVALQDEFEEVACTLSARTLSVTTAPIVLEGRKLGRFCIELEWDCLGAPPDYRVVALEPSPAEEDELVTHPHVREESLCAGDGLGALQAALAAGRLYDFFLIVSRILNTYSRGQAYVELANWECRQCADCGSSVADADCCYCYGCDATLCSDCQTYCGSCDEGRCASCLHACSACQTDHCAGCLANCRLCKHPVCSGCLQNGLCPDCCQGDADHESSPQEEAAEANS